MTPIIEFKNLEKSFGRTKAVDNVTLSLAPGKIIGLLGPNGSGKSTLFKLMNGLLEPTKGQVLIEGKAPSIESRKIISYLPERTYLNEWMKIRDIFRFFSDFYEDFDLTKAREMLKVLNLDEKHPLKPFPKETRRRFSSFSSCLEKPRFIFWMNPLVVWIPQQETSFWKPFSAIIRKMPP